MIVKHLQNSIVNTIIVGKGINQFFQPFCKCTNGYRGWGKIVCLKMLRLVHVIFPVHFNKNIHSFF